MPKEKWQFRRRSSSTKIEDPHPQLYPITKAKSASKEQHKQVITLLTISETQFGVAHPYELKQELAPLLKKYSAKWCSEFKIWRINLGHFTPMRVELPEVQNGLTIEDIPQFARKALKGIPLFISNGIFKLDYSNDISQPNPLVLKLYEFQRECVKFSGEHHGRVLIGDMMGVGKSVEALACSLEYISEFPLLIVCPSSLKIVWRDEIKKWLSTMFTKEQIHIVHSSNDFVFTKLIKVVIISYQILTKSCNTFKDFKVVICDEAHYLKNPDTKRSEHLIPFLASRRRIFLLTGTPALSNPKELYNLLFIIRPDVYTDAKIFNERYCDLKYNTWTHRPQFQGCRNLAELHYLLKKVMIRRLKIDVLKDLPLKLRQVITIPCDKALTKDIQRIMETSQLPLSVLRSSEKMLQNMERGNMAQAYLMSGLAKLDGVKQYLQTILENDIKVLVFAHHKAIINEIESFLKSISIESITIDGDVPLDQRTKRIARFQGIYQIRVAILSITAAGVGYTLTAASTVIFAELHWTPAVLLQCEDRAHRIGQKCSVNVHYLIGEDTIDGMMLRNLQKKIDRVGKVLDGEGGTLALEATQIGRISQGINVIDSKGQTKITDYFSRRKEEPNCERINPQKCTEEKNELTSEYSEDSLIIRSSKKRKMQLRILNYLPDIDDKS